MAAMYMSLWLKFVFGDDALEDISGCLSGGGGGGEGGRGGGHERHMSNLRRNPTNHARLQDVYAGSDLAV